MIIKREIKSSDCLIPSPRKNATGPGKRKRPGTSAGQRPGTVPGHLFPHRGRSYALGAAATVFFIHSVVTLLGRSIGVPIARLMMSCESMPIARETENSTV